jgi:hypothetical protein
LTVIALTFARLLLHPCKASDDDLCLRLEFFPQNPTDRRGDAAVVGDGDDDDDDFGGDGEESGHVLLAFCE